VLGGRLTALGAASFPLAQLLDLAVPTAVGVCSFIVAAFLFRLVDGRFFASGGERHNLFFDRSS
jgi:hypothetical protein